MPHQLLYTGGTLSPENLRRLTDAGFTVQVVRANLSEDELIAALNGKDAYVLAGVEKATAKVLRQAASLKVLAFLGVGYQSFIDAEAAATQGIAVTNAPGANAQAVAEFAIGLMVDCVRRLTYLITETKQGRWLERASWNLHGRTLGIIGLGAIGSRVARIAQRGFGMDIVYHSRSRKSIVEEELGAQPVSLPELLRRADVVTLHAPYGPATVGMLGVEQLALLKPSAVIVNTSRVELIDPAALRQAVVEGRIAAVALDGYYAEPVPEPAKDPYGLLSLPHDRVLVSPHTAYLTQDSMDTTLEINVTSIQRLLRGEDDSRVVNPGFQANARWWKPAVPGTNA
jgi:gluconate 2-dehydrogenase